MRHTNEYFREYYRKNHARVRAIQKKYKLSKKGIQTRNARYKLDPEVQRARTLRWRYHITLDEFHAMEKSQNGVCAICLKPETRISKWGTPDRVLKIDHCKRTGKIRGLLCHRCNVSLGLMDDDPSRFERAVQYLEKSRINHVAVPSE